MSQHSLSISNESGLLFRQDVNNALQAIANQQSGSTEPTIMYAFQLWVDTSGGNPILKQRNAANSAWITIGRVDIANFGMLPLTGGTMSAAVLFSNTDFTTIPKGTTAQRPGSPAAGYVRYNTDLTQFEGYNGSAWAPIGGGGYTTTAVESIAASASITSSTSDQRQLRIIQGSSAPVSASTTPFGSGGGWKDGTEILLVGNDDTNTVKLTYNDAAKGLVGNFSVIEITKYKSILCTYYAAMDRWIVTGGI